MKKEDVTADDLFVLQMIKRIGQAIDADETRYVREFEEWIDAGLELGMHCGGPGKLNAGLPATSAQTALATKLFAAMDSVDWKKPKLPPPAPPYAMSEHDLMILRAYGRGEPLVIAKLQHLDGQL
jgi:hypothetical protein